MAKKKRARRTHKVSRSKKPVRSNKEKINLVLRKLILFAILTAISYLVHSMLSVGTFKVLFQILYLLLGFISVAFLIVLLVLVFMKILKK